MNGRMLVGTRKGLFVYQRDGERWQLESSHFPSVPVGLVHHDARDGAWYASLDHGHFGSKLQRSTDSGGTWTEIAIPKYPEKPRDVIDVDPMRKTPRPWQLKSIWALASGRADQPGLLWCGTIPGGLFRSEDSGASWDLVRSLWDHPSRAKWFGGGADYPAIHSICVHPDDGNHLLVGISCGGVWQTRDGGETWNICAEGMRAAYMPPELADDQDIQDPHMMVQCPANPDHLWVQHHNGIFRSTDCSESWTEMQGVEPSSFGFAVAVHPRDPNRAWFIPAASDEQRIPVDGKVVVTHTRDGGQTFEVQRNGLPQNNAWDIVFRHALDIDDSGDHLAFGSTTGALWVTSDQGQQWQLLEGHLPPIYSVRFEKR